jgi:uncharacterized protein
MERTKIFEVALKHDEQLHRVGATHMYLYGSRARADARPDSDVDLFIDYDPEVRVPSLFKLVETEQALSAELGVPVSIATRNALHPLMRDVIEREATPIF